MEEINLKELFEYYVGKLYIIFAITALVMMVGCIYQVVLKVPMYNSSTTLILARMNDSAGEASGITTTDLTLNQKLVSTYSAIIKSRRILNQVIQDLSLDMTTEQLSKYISVSNEADTELIKITVKTEDPELSASIADDIASVFSKEIINLYEIRNVGVLDYAEVAAKPSNINAVKSVLMFFVVGLALSCGLIFVFYYFDTTIKNSEVIEEKIGLPVLGEVPSFYSDRKGGK